MRLNLGDGMELFCHKRKQHEPCEDEKNSPKRHLLVSSQIRPGVLQVFFHFVSLCSDSLPKTTHCTSMLGPSKATLSRNLNFPPNLSNLRVENSPTRKAPFAGKRGNPGSPGRSFFFNKRQNGEGK